MVVLNDLSGSEADLVAVGGRARRRAFGDDRLWQFAGQGGGVGFARVGTAGEAQRLVNVGAAGERVADGAADAGRRTTVGFDFGRVVVGFVFELQQPRARLPVFINVNINGAGVHFGRNLHVLQTALRALVFGVNGCQIHQCIRTGGGFVAIDCLPLRFVVGEIIGECRAEIGLREGDVVQGGSECRVAAVVRPVGIKYADFRLARLAVFLAEMALHQLQIGQRHREALCGVPGGEAVRIKRVEPVITRHRVGGVMRRQRRFRQIFLAAVDGVNQVLAQLGARVIIQIALKQPRLRAGDNRRREGVIEQAQALHGGVGALVELPRQRLNDEGEIRLGQGVAHFVADRVAENAADGSRQQRFRAVVEVIHGKPPHPLQSGEIEAGFQALGEGVVVGKFGTFFDKKALVHGGFRVK